MPWAILNGISKHSINGLCPHSPFAVILNNHGTLDRPRRRITEKDAQEIVALPSKATMADDLSRFFRDPSANAPGPVATMLRTTRQKGATHEDFHRNLRRGRAALRARRNRSAPPKRGRRQGSQA